MVFLNGLSSLIQRLLIQKDLKPSAEEKFFLMYLTMSICGPISGCIEVQAGFLRSQ